MAYRSFEWCNGEPSCSPDAQASAGMTGKQLPQRHLLTFLLFSSIS